MDTVASDESHVILLLKGFDAIKSQVTGLKKLSPLAYVLEVGKFAFGGAKDWAFSKATQAAQGLLHAPLPFEPVEGWEKLALPKPGLIFGSDGQLPLLLASIDPSFPRLKEIKILKPGVEIDGRRYTPNYVVEAQRRLGGNLPHIDEDRIHANYLRQRRRQSYAATSESFGANGRRVDPQSIKDIVLKVRYFPSGLVQVQDCETRTLYTYRRHVPGSDALPLPGNEASYYENGRVEKLDLLDPESVAEPIDFEQFAGEIIQSMGGVQDFTLPPPVNTPAELPARVFIPAVLRL